MIRFKHGIGLHDLFHSSYIVKYNDLYEDELLEAIEVFNNEIEWKDMWTLDDARDRIRRGWVLNILRFGHHIHGWTWLDMDSYYIRNVYVSKTYRNKGWGSNLVRATCSVAYYYGISTLYSEVDEWNESSLTMFKNLGWTGL